jgi:hypothetical protein
MNFYVSPEQAMKDRADYARKGIARGRSLVGIEYVDGVVVVAENPSASLNKVAEIYDRITPTSPATPTRATTSPPVRSPTPTRRRSARSSPTR